MFKFSAKKIALFFFITALVIMPVASFAETDYVGAAPPGPDSIPSIVSLINRVLDVVWKIFFAAAVIMFIVAGVEFITARGEPGKVGKARAFVIWGVVGIIVAVSAFSIVRVVTDLLLPPVGSSENPAMEDSDARWELV